jgi:hypothetical protein
MTVAHRVSFNHRHPGSNLIEPGRSLWPTQPPNTLVKVSPWSAFDPVAVGTGIIPDSGNMLVIDGFDVGTAGCRQDSFRISFIEEPQSMIRSPGHQEKSELQLNQ